jgi:predicted nucleic acid-binding protein
MQLSELGRSRQYRRVPGDFTELAAVLAGSSAREQSRLQRTVASLLSAAEIIPLDASVIGSASDIQLEYGMSGQDSIVFASVLTHLTSKKPAIVVF